MKLDLQQIVIFILVINLVVNLFMVYILYERLIRCKEKVGKFQDKYREAIKKEKMYNKIIKDVK